jgi:heme/copper-type cytochrome/quinol oxidase subunit 3
MHSDSWSVASVVLLFALIAFVIGLVLALSVVTKPADQIECDRGNTTRATLFLLISFSAVILVLVAQRYELQHAVHHLME